MDDRETYMNVKITKADSWSPSRELRTQKILDGMDDRETYMNVKITNTDSRSPSRAEHDVSYGEINFKTVSEPRVRTDRGAHDQESKLKIGKRLHCLICLLCLVTFALIVTVTAFSIHVSQIRQSQTTLDRNCHELNSILQSEINEMETKYKAVNETKAQICELLTSRRGPHKQESKENIGNRAYHKICLLCLVTSILVAIVAGLSIHASQTRQSLIGSDRNYRRLWEQHQEMNRSQRQCQQQVRELNSTVKSRTSENSRLDLSQRNCLKNISVLNNNLSKLENNITVLNSDLSELNQTHTDLHRQFNQLETKYKTISENKVQICQYLTSRREQTCPQDWIDNEDRCYLISRLENSYDGAREHCSKFDARLLEINSNVERDFVSSSFDSEYRYHWIENCGDGHTMDPPPALSATRTHRATVVKGNRDSSARSLHIYTQIFLKRSKVSVNTPWDRLQSNDNTPLHPIQSTPLSPPHPFIPSQPLCPNTYPILLLYSHPHSPPLLPLPPSELLFFPLGPALPISATHIYSPFPTLFTLCPSNPQLIPLLFFPLLHGPHFLPPLSGSLHQLSLQFCTHWPSVHQQRGKVCAHSPCLCLSWLHTYAPRNKAPSFMPSLHNSDPRVPATSS
ncbi:uncharacterized protein [Mobula birostris]|uniref:uncharacterized protein isoform X2 n=1 Tax=Mobula birostris TaxID=1983395 RepID=UPI003B28C885